MGIAGMTTPMRASGQWKRQSAAGGALGATFHVTVTAFFQFFSLLSVALAYFASFFIFNLQPSNASGRWKRQSAAGGALGATLSVTVTAFFFVVGLLSLCIFFSFLIYSPVMPLPAQADDGAVPVRGPRTAPLNHVT